MTRLRSDSRSIEGRAQAITPAELVFAARLGWQAWIAVPKTQATGFSSTKMLARPSGAALGELRGLGEALQNAEKTRGRAGPELAHGSQD